MSNREAIADLAGIYINTLNRGHGVITRFEQGNRAAEAILEAGYRKPRTITTTAEVDALPDRAVTITCFGDAVTIYRDHPDLPPEHYHFLVEGRAATVLYEPEPQP